MTTVERSAPVAPIPATPAGYLVADVGALGVLLTQDGEAATATGVPTTPRLIPLFDAQRDDGPPIECARTGQPIRIADIRAARSRWRVFADAVSVAGLRSVHTLPMRADDTVVGAITLFHPAAGQLTPTSDRLACAVAALTADILALHRQVEQERITAGQLQSALNTRIVIEQAKGFLAAVHHTSPDEEFRTMRAFARRNNRKVREVASAVLRGETDLLA